LIPWLLLLGCTPAPDDWIEPSISAALDYRVDRTRVAAIRLDPPIQQSGGEVVVDALVLSPGPVAVRAVEGCGLRTDGPARVIGAACFSTPDLVFPIATRLPATWRAPDLSAAPGFVGCPRPPEGEPPWLEPNACQSVFPILVTADGDDDLGLGVVDVRLDVGREGGVPRPLHDQEIALEAEVLGDTVELRFTWTPDAPLFDDVTDLDTNLSLSARWLVDDGVLAGTGRTTVTRGSDGVWWTENALHIPDGYEGPLRVAAIFDLYAEDPNFPAAVWSDAAWRVATVEVSP
jgi:hypothetical protein